MSAGAWLCWVSAGIAEENSVPTIDLNSWLLPATVWTTADYDFSHPSFDTDWRSRLADLGAAKIVLSLEPHAGTSRASNSFEGASVRTTRKTHYGRYQADIRPARGSGIVTGFFTYTGAAYGTRHDEIDIEFLGRDTTRIHLAWFRDGVLQSRFIDLGFDAAEDWHTYAFEWLPDRISWYVDGVLLFETENDSDTLPQKPSLLFANIWIGDNSIKNWSGEAEPGTVAASQFRSILFIPLEDLAAQDLWAVKERIATRESATLP